MTTDLRAAIEAWQAAHHEACAAEDLLTEMLLFHVERKGPPITDALVREVVHFRGRAHNRLTVALSLMNR